MVPLAPFRRESTRLTSTLAQLGTPPVELVGAFGGRDQYLEALREMERELYGSAA